LNQFETQIYSCNRNITSVLYNNNISARYKDELASICSRVVILEADFVPMNFAANEHTAEFARWRYTGTKLNVFNLTRFDRVLLMDSVHIKKKKNCNTLLLYFKYASYLFMLLRINIYVCKL
jgi:alpha-N-acetylglucosamine transferase